MPADELGDIASFIRQAMQSTGGGGGGSGGGGGGGGAAAGGGAAPSAEARAARTAQLVAMGFDGAAVAAALARAQWDVEAALALLLG